MISRKNMLGIICTEAIESDFVPGKIMKKKSIEGKHIKIQIYGVKFHLLNDVSLVNKFLLDMVHAAKMRELDKPHVYDIKETLTKNGFEPDKDEPEGVIGIVVLSTSHVAIHTWPHRGYAVVDLFSCRDFEERDITWLIVDILKPTKMAVHDLSFSLEMPEIREHEP